MYEYIHTIKNIDIDDDYVTITIFIYFNHVVVRLVHMDGKFRVLWTT